MARNVFTPEMDAWMLREYGRGDPVGQVLDDFAETFGWRPTERGFYVHACRLGCKRGSYGRDSPERAVRPVFWCREPEMQRWMVENNEGKTVKQVSQAFEERFGFPLSRPQVTTWREKNGFASRHSPRKSVVPVGTVKENAKGYLVIKTALHPKRPGSKDNWRLLSAVKWEQMHGRPLPEDMVVVFANHDRHDLSPENLVAIPKCYVARVNAADTPDWNTPEELAACLELVRLTNSICRAEAAIPRKCGVCGREFVPGGTAQKGHVTCPQCIAEGHRSKGTRKARKGPATARCAVCGKEFARESARQRRCRQCIEEAPKHGVSEHKRMRERRSS